MNPIISVIIPVYKCEKYLSECIESVLNQTFKDFELILVNDGSPDNSPQICDDYAQRDTRIKVIHKENGGVSSARNEGIKQACGEYITFIDSDDYIDKDFLQYAFYIIKESNVDMFVSGILLDYWQEESIQKTQEYTRETSVVLSVKTLMEEWAEGKFPSICMCSPCCKLYKLDVIKEFSLSFDEGLSCGEDTYFNLSVLSCINKIYFSEKVFYHYRRGNEYSLFSRFHKDLYEIHAKVTDRRRKLMKKLHCSELSLNRLEEDYFRLLWGCLYEYFHFYDETSYKEKSDLLKKIGNDENIKRCRLKQLVSRNNRLWLFLIKIKAYKIILYYFERMKRRDAL